MKYPHIPELHRLSRIMKEALFENAYVFEKLDGGNVQVAITGEVVTHGLRSGSLRGTRAPWKEEFKRWYWTNRESIDELPDGTYFGEFLAPHTVQYKPEYTNKFFLIDVFICDALGDGFVSYERALELARPARSAMLPAPLLHKGAVTADLIEKLVNGKSEYSVSGVREGIVIKNYPLQTFAKVLRRAANNEI